jgi:hypothetical protein
VLSIVSGGPALLRAAASRDAARGKLAADAAGRPLLRTGTGRALRLEGDADTTGTDLEVLGRAPGPGRFRIDPIHTRALFVLRQGRRLTVTYWCDVCHIRTYTPGKCACCQKETDLDLRDPDEE